MKPTIERNDPERARRYFQDKLAYTTCPTGLAKAMKEGTVRVIDVRAKGDFDKEHLPGSTNLVEGDWPTERGLGRDQVNVLLCYSQTCHLAARAALEFATRGYSVQELEGGFAGWKEHHLPTESGEREPGDALDRTRSMLEARRATEANGPAAAKGTAAAPEAGAEKPQPSEQTGGEGKTGSAAVAAEATTAPAKEETKAKEETSAKKEAKAPRAEEEPQAQEEPKAKEEVKAKEAPKPKEEVKAKEEPKAKAESKKQPASPTAPR